MCYYDVMVEEKIIHTDKKDSSMPTGRQAFWKNAWDLLRFGLIAVLIVLPIRIFIAQPFIVSGSSMVPTFENGEYLIIDELSYHLRQPERGEVVVFRYPKNTKLFFIKRIIGLPGETIKINGESITVKNSEQKESIKLDESYIKNQSSNDLEISLGTDEYFVMGDNRAYSSDSRAWGALPEKLIIGRAFLRLWPIAQAGLLPGNQ